MSKTRFRTPFDNQPVKVCQTLLKSARQHFYHILPSLQAKSNCKLSLVVISEILAMFFSTLTADDKYSLRNRENLWQAIQMQLSKK